MTKQETEFARGDAHDQRVPVLLTADEYLFARDEAARRGIAISAYFRALLLSDRRHVALGELSPDERYHESAGNAQELHTVVSAAVSAALAAYENARKL